MRTYRTALVLGVFLSTIPLAVLGQQPALLTPVTLRVSVDGQILSEGEVVTLRRGQSVQLRVTMIRSDGTISDVTNDPFTSFTSLSRWNLSVSDTGPVTAVGSAGYSEETRLLTSGLVDVVYGIKPSTMETLGEVGNISVEFQLTN
jgi:hypothetical protein